jgi:hypothetical protein
MKRAWILRAAGAIAVLGLTLSAATADEGNSILAARLTGFQDAPANLTNGSGTFVATIHGDNTITYRLQFQNLTTPVTQAHIHFAQPNVNGGIFVWLCQTAAAPAPAAVSADVPMCPVNGGTVTGTVKASDILAISNQGVAAGDFEGLEQIVRSGNAYVNVHTVQIPAGEIRGQVRSGF